MRRVPWMGLLTLALAACSAPATARPTATPFTGTPRPVIIDTDMAQDDWVAILYLLQRQDVAVKAITVTGAGVAHCGPGVQHALGLAALAGQPGIPVACGRETPLQGEHVFPAEWRQNVDGMSGLSLPENPNPPAPQAAVELILTTVAEAAQAPTVLALGPLTNLAEAFQADPGLADRVAMIYIMGGAVDAAGNVGVSGVGIDNPYAEWNFYIDPTAASVVVQSGAPLTLVPLDATNHVPVTGAFYDRLRLARHTPEAQFVFDLFTQQAYIVESGTYSFWDPLAAAILIDEDLATFETRGLAVVVEEGPESGRLVPDEGGPRVRYAVSADAARFEPHLLETLNAQWP